MRKVLVVGFECDVAYAEKQLVDCEIIREIIIVDIKNFNSLSVDVAIWELCDYAIIAVDDKDSDIVYNELMHLPQAEDKLLDFFMLARNQMPHMTADRVFQNPRHDEFETIILGLSHAELGIVPEKLPGSAASIAVGGQDIFYNFEVLKYCYEKYPQKLKKVKHIVFDMFDYTYFNYDTSLASNATIYFIKSGGITIPHHYRESKNAPIDFDYLMDNLRLFYERDLTDKQYFIWNEIVEPGLVGHPEFKEWVTAPFISKRTLEYKPSNDVVTGFLNNSLIYKRHEDTIEENVNLFFELLDFVMDKNPNMNIKILILPQYIDAIRYKSPAMDEWKTEFYDLIEFAKSQYPLEVLDYKYCDISNNAKWFNDIDHLNYKGALVFSDILSEHLQ